MNVASHFVSLVKKCLYHWGAHSKNKKEKKTLPFKKSLTTICQFFSYSVYYVSHSCEVPLRLFTDHTHIHTALQLLWGSTARLLRNHNQPHKHMEHSGCTVGKGCSYSKRRLPAVYQKWCHRKWRHSCGLEGLRPAALHGRATVCLKTTVVLTNQQLRPVTDSMQVPHVFIWFNHNK